MEKPYLNLRDISYISPHKFLSSYDIKVRRGENDLYAMVISLFFLLEPSFLKLFFISELGSFDKVEDCKTYFKACNFPNNFRENIENIKSVLMAELKNK